MPVRTKSEADIEINSMMLSSFDENGKKMWVCCMCKLVLPEKRNMYRHIDQAHYKYSYGCEHCGRLVPTQNALMTHINNKHK